MASLTQKAKAAHVVVECGPELYHLECYRRENGDNDTIMYLSKHYQKTEKLTPADGAIRAGNFLKDVESLKRGAFKFKQARENAKSTNVSDDVELHEFSFVGA